MTDEQQQIEEMAKVTSPYCDFCKITKCENCNRKKTSKCRYYSFAKRCIMNGYRKASEVIDEFVEKINLVECEMFHKAHDIRNSSEEKLDRCNWKDDLQWGEYKKQEGKMIALQDFMTKIKRIAAEYGVEV